MKKDPPSQFLDFEQSLEFMTRLASEDFPYRVEGEHKRHRILAVDELRNPLWEFRLPLPLAALPEDPYGWKTYMADLPEEIPEYVLLLVQLGAAALGYYEEGEVYAHKTFKKYMKRHKRGKAQISYLNTRGKSKAGSRLRLANTVKFFEEINEKMQEWEEDYEVNRIIYSCTAQVWGLLFQSQTPLPFGKKDPRLIKAPLDVKIPGFEEMERVSSFIQQGKLILHQEAKHPLDLLC